MPFFMSVPRRCGWLEFSMAGIWQGVCGAMPIQPAAKTEPGRCGKILPRNACGLRILTVIFLHQHAGYDSAGWRKSRA